MADAFVDLGLTIDPSALADTAVQRLEGAIPGYVPNPANLEVIHIDAESLIAGDVATVAAQVPPAIFRNYGTKLMGVPYETGASANAVVTFNLEDTLGHTIPAGTELVIEGLGFTVQTDIVVAPGASSGNGIVVAVEQGAAYNGVSSPADLINSLDWVSSLTVTGQTANGVDPETDADYQNRLAGQLTLQAPRPITATDYAVMALSFQPVGGTTQQEIGRATAIDGYDPNTLTFGNARMVAVFVTAADGTALNSATMTALDAWLSSFREVNFIVNVLAPTYTTVYVSFSIHCYPGFDQTATALAAQTAVLNYLSPANWRAPTFGNQAGWLNDTTIRVNKLVGVIEQVTGVDYVAAGSLTLGTSPSPVGTSDLTLTGPAPLPQTTATTVPVPAVV